MSLDITIASRALGTDQTDEAAFDVASPPVPRAWLQNLMVGAVAFGGVLFSSALGVLLFLR